MSADYASWPGGPILHALRRGAGLTQYQVSHLIGVHHSYVSRVETSNRRPTLNVLKRWVMVIGCPKLAPDPHLQALWHLDTDPWRQAWEWAVSQSLSHGTFVSHAPVLSTAATRLGLKCPETLEATEGSEARETMWHALIWLGTVVLLNQYPIPLWTPPDNPEGFWTDINATRSLDGYGAPSASDPDALKMLVHLWPYLQTEDQTTLAALARRFAVTKG